MDRAALEQRADRAAQIWRTKSNAEDLGTFLADFAEREMSLAGTPAQCVSEEEQHAINHARYQVEHVSLTNPDCCFDVDLVKDLLRVVDRGARAQPQPAIGPGNPVFEETRAAVSAAREKLLAEYRAENERLRVTPDLADPVVVHANMLRGTIAKPSWENIKHLYPEQFAVPQTAPTSEEVARTICLSYGRDPDMMTSVLEMCDANNRPVATWMVYEEQAEAVLVAYSLSRPKCTPTEKTEGNQS